MPSKNDHVSMTVWCPLIPLEDIGKLVGHENELSRINGAYDDWRVSMRSKPLVGVDMGVLLDRIRMLMINVGIAGGQDRILASRVQSILSDALRNNALILIERMFPASEGLDQFRVVLNDFFTKLKFTRDIFPEEEMEKAVSKNVMGSGSGAVKELLLQGTKVVKNLYIRLLSPDPWGW
ncbi:MAG: hypothetical protein JSW61_06980 [Candidatus Thorarchaeota archaeon]|nr:MAG: hypothetical protein JSW61_06980 [Candidatus Thorarchaeota archaeon]